DAGDGAIAEGVDDGAAAWCGHVNAITTHRDRARLRAAASHHHRDAAREGEAQKLHWRSPREELGQTKICVSSDFRSRILKLRRIAVGPTTFGATSRRQL